jgi:hypothetical protein
MIGRHLRSIVQVSLVVIHIDRDPQISDAKEGIVVDVED